MGFSRQEYWSVLPFPSPGDLPDPRSNLGLLHWQGDFLSSEPPGKPPQIKPWSWSQKSTAHSGDKSHQGSGLSRRGCCAALSRRPHVDGRQGDAEGWMRAEAQRQTWAPEAPRMAVAWAWTGRSKAGSQGSGFYRLEDMDEFCSQEHLVDLCVGPLGGPGGDDCRSWRTSQRHPQERGWGTAFLEVLPSWM